MGIGYYLSTYVLPAVLAFLMLGMGMTLTFKDFKNIILYPKSIAMALGLQMIILPGIAFTIAALAPISPSLKVGFILIAACPGGTVSNLLSHLLRANLALSVSLTAVNSFLVVFSLPAIVNLGLLAFLGDTKSLDLPFWKTLLEILQITVIPCIVGILIRRYLPQLAKNLEKPLEYIMPVLLGITLAATVYFKESDPPINYLEHIFLLPYALSLNLLGMIIGYYSPKLLKISRRNRLTMSLEVGLQNTGLAITVATSANLLNDAEMAIPAVIYALFTFFTATGWGVWINRSRKEKSSKKVSTNKEVASNS